MPALAVETHEDVPTPRRVKISSKRQITIPVDVYKRQGFTEYALLTETPDGLVIQPLQLTDDDEEITLSLLRYLVEQGCEGKDLIAKYEELKPRFASYAHAVKRSEADIANDRTIDFDELQSRMREEYGL